MGYTVRVLPEHRLALLRLHGEADAGDILGGMARLVGDPAWEPPFDAVWDCRAVTALDLQPRDLSDIAGLLRTVSERRGTGRRAVIVRNEMEADLAHLLSRMAGRDKEREMRTFRQAGEAAYWLGVPVGALEPA
jgi:hypothetical protein